MDMSFQSQTAAMNTPQMQVLHFFTAYSKAVLEKFTKKTAVRLNVLWK
jgi:hypothetical protein